METSEKRVTALAPEKELPSADELTPLLAGNRDVSRVSREEAIIERGLIRFYYRPHMQGEETGNLDLQRLFVLLAPAAHRADDIPRSFQKKRLLVIGRRTLQVSSEPGKASTPHTSVWCLVDVVSTDQDEIARVIGDQDDLHQNPGSRPHASAIQCGDGIYAIVRFQDHSHLVYRVSWPGNVSDVQRDFHIEPEGSYVLAVKNPQYPTASSNVKLPRSRFPPELQSLLGERRHSPVLDSAFLDYVGAELLMVGVTRESNPEELEPSELASIQRPPDLGRYLREDAWQSPPPPPSGLQERAPKA
jgi:hypothetical protein